MAMPDDAHRYCGGYYDAHTCEEIDSLTERAEKAEAQVQAVRELRDRFRDHEKWVSYRNVETLLTRALDGDA
jgi:hypothetical protein